MKQIEKRKYTVGLERKGMKKIIGYAWHLVKRVYGSDGMRSYPEQSELEFDEMINLEQDELFPGYRKNLEEIK